MKAGNGASIRTAASGRYGVDLIGTTHDDVHEWDERRCLLARHLQQILPARQTGAEEVTIAGLACAGLAYLERLPTGAWSG